MNVTLHIYIFNISEKSFQRHHFDILFKWTNEASSVIFGYQVTNIFHKSIITSNITKPKIACDFEVLQPV